MEDVRFPNSHKRVGEPDWMVYGVALVNSDSMTEFIYCHSSINAITDSIVAVWNQKAKAMPRRKIFCDIKILWTSNRGGAELEQAGEAPEEKPVPAAEWKQQPQQS